MVAGDLFKYLNKEKGKNDKGSRTYSIGSIMMVKVSMNIMIKIKEPDDHVQFLQP